MLRTVLLARETATKSGAHTWQRDCAHARLVTRDREIEITVSVPSHGRSYIYKNCTPVARLGGLAPARPIIIYSNPVNAWKILAYYKRRQYF